MKCYTSRKSRKCIEVNSHESRRDWLTRRFRRAGKENSNVVNGQFWRQHNKPIELWSAEVIEQKVGYIHNNPVEAGFVNEPWYCRYSSAIDLSGSKGVIEIDLL